MFYKFLKIKFFKLNFEFIVSLFLIKIVTKTFSQRISVTTHAVIRTYALKSFSFRMI